MNKRLYIYGGIILMVILGYQLFLRDQLTVSYDPNEILTTANEVVAVESDPVEHIEVPNPVRAIYMTSWVASRRDLRSALVDFIRDSSVNSVVIDVKDYSGTISFITGDPEIEAVGSEENRIPDIKEFIDELHSHGIYTIARITVFQDPIFATYRPDLAVQDTRGGVWEDNKGLSFIDAGAQEHWDYTVAIAEASERVGFDELNFDYIRFPSDGPMKYAAYPISGVNGDPLKADVMETFFAYLHSRLKDVGVPTSADLFGFVTTNYGDLNIGQVLERAAPYFDYIAPMVYPSHYPNGYNGFANPANYPYEVIHIAMTTGSERLLAASSTPEKLRPWIQDFDLGADYGVEEVRAQIRASEDAGNGSWMSWAPSNRYTEQAYYLVE